VRSVIDPRSLRGRLTLAFAAALLVGLCAFAAAAVVLLRQMERVTLDRQLSAAATATLGIVEDSHHHLELEASDRRQFREILGLQLNGVVYDAAGNVVDSNVAEVPPSVAAAARSEAGTTTAGSGDDRARVDVVPIAHDGNRLGTIVLWRPIEWFAFLDRGALLGSVLIIALIGIPATIAGALIAKRGLRPLERIADVASEIEAHDLAQRIVDVPTPNDELGRLSVTFNRMLDRLQAAFERERRFTADASHELRAPLAVIAAETSLALRRERDAASYRKTLHVIADVTSELQSLVDDLLDAVRDEDAAVPSNEPLDLARATATAVDLLAPLSHERNVSLTANLEPLVFVRGDARAIGRALVAVVDNALKFTPSGGSVHVTLDRDAGDALVRVRDDGPGFSDEALTHALERFWRADPARSPGSGSGLGLAIARAAVERNGGSIALANDGVDGNAVVVIRFPAVAGVSSPRTIP
jgi:signal transduction histidine kinase